MNWGLSNVGSFGENGGLSFHQMKFIKQGITLNCGSKNCVELLERATIGRCFHPYAFPIPMAVAEKLI